MPLTTIRKGERDDSAEEYAFIKADKTNRASLPVTTVLKASLESNYVAWRSPLWTLLGSVYGTTACIFKLKCFIQESQLFEFETVRSCLSLKKKISGIFLSWYSFIRKVGIPVCPGF